MKKNYKIGDSLWRYAGLGKFFEYIVTGIVSREKITLYEAECQQCEHGFKCLVLITEDDYGEMKYVSMVNENEEDKQYYWHNEGYYYDTKKIAIQKEFERRLLEAKKDLEDRIKGVAKKEDEIRELESFIANI